jgi:hypothetical protein
MEIHERAMHERIASLQAGRRWMLLQVGLEGGRFVVHLLQSIAAGGEIVSAASNANIIHN